MKFKKTCLSALLLLEWVFGIIFLVFQIKSITSYHYIISIIFVLDLISLFLFRLQSKNKMFNSVNMTFTILLFWIPSIILMALNRIDSIFWTIYAIKIFTTSVMKIILVKKSN